MPEEKNVCSELSGKKNHLCPHCEKRGLVNISKLKTHHEEITCPHCKEPFEIEVEHRSAHRKEVSYSGQIKLPNGQKCGISITSIGANGIGFVCSKKIPAGMATLKFCLSDMNQEMKIMIKIATYKEHPHATFKIFDPIAVPKDVKTIRFWLKDYPAAKAKAKAKAKAAAS